MSLPEPHTEAGRAGLAALLADPGKALVALDFDGTLAPIVADPTTSRMAAGALLALQRLAVAVGGLAIVTGRQAQVAVDVGGLAAVPGLIIEGQYGAEQWRDGVLTLPDPPPGIARVRAELPELLATADPGVWVEDKVSSLVVHTRRAADPSGELARLSPVLVPLAERHGLEGNSGRNVVEIRPPGIDKGGALRRLVEEVRPSAVLFGGDDVGDLPAFATVAELRSDGVAGLTVCSVSNEAPQIAERADLTVDGPAGVVAFLTGLADAIG
ncbi:MAG TPA: trehalose-phosphatase [Mycobacteriales bacterium]|nr:trehalose-phosphatase [Mycobacteriales bacterium]